MNSVNRSFKDAVDHAEYYSAIESVEQLEQELADFEQHEKSKLGIEEEEVVHWVDHNPQKFTASQRENTTILFGGLTVAQDYLIQQAMRGAGYKIISLDEPNYESLHYGKEYGNRGQCNPTYFTVGNLIKQLVHLRDVEGLSTEEITTNYLFCTPGACGPCRFGTYATEYRKALRDAGFPKFRVLLFQQQGGIDQANGEELGLKFTPKFFFKLFQAAIIGDLLNVTRNRMRPYEVEPGAANKALEECKKIVGDALENNTSILRSLRRCRKVLDKVKVDRLQPKPKVMIIGEFWAMTTEGDGNYRLQEFLEKEGAECEIQMVIAWPLFMLWEHKWDTLQRIKLKQTDEKSKGLSGKNPYHKLALVWGADKFVRFLVKFYGRLLGLKNLYLPDMNELAEISHDYYHNEIRGGEGHMEVGKLIVAAKKRKAHMVVSVKPFGCMPSASISDGVQSLVTKHYPDIIFCPVETSGDGAVNFQSRVQMFLFKARQKAKAEFEQTLSEKGLDAKRLTSSVVKQKGMDYPRQKVAGTASNIILSL